MSGGRLVCTTRVDTANDIEFIDVHDASGQLIGLMAANPENVDLVIETLRRYRQRPALRLLRGGAS